MSLLHKTEKQQNNNDQLIRLMTPMIAGILACIFCLVSMTWAWFNGYVNSGAHTIQSASRSTSVTVYELSQLKAGNNSVTKTLIKPSRAVSPMQMTDQDAIEVVAGDTLVWELSPEKSYEVVMTGSGTASTGYCEVVLSHTVSGSDTAGTEIYTTPAFEKENTLKFTYNTGGFSSVEGVTETQYREYVEKTAAPTLTIASYWGTPTEKEEVRHLPDGAVLGLTPIPCPEAKAKSDIELVGFEIEEGGVISANEDYKISLTLIEGYEMPSEVVVNIGGKDYVVSTQGAEKNETAPYYSSGILTVPAALLSDGTAVYVKAVATPIPVEASEEETNQEETNAEPTEEDNSEDTAPDNNVVADDPTKEDEGEEQKSDKPRRNPVGSGGNDFDDTNQGEPSVDNSSAPDNNEEETEVEKVDVTLNLSQLTINLEETQIPTNADLVLTLSAKENMELPEQIIITLDKTVYDENEGITEGKTEYIINTDGTDNPEGFQFDVESGNLKISSELLVGVGEITITDTNKHETDEDNKKTAITFEVKNLTFDFTDNEIEADEDVVITFTAEQGYELPETIIIIIDGEEFIVYTSNEEGAENPDGITFDTETGTLTISKDLLVDVNAITITAEGTEKQEENITDNENEAEGGETADKENGTDIPVVEGNTGNEGDTTNPDETTEVETGDAESDTVNPTEDNTNEEQNGENTEIEESDKDSIGDVTEETTEPTPDSDSESSVELGEPVVMPEVPDADEENNGETTDTDDNSVENEDDTEGNTPSESITAEPVTSEPNTSDSSPVPDTDSHPSTPGDTSVLPKSKENTNENDALS